MTKQVAAVVVAVLAFLAGGLFTGYTHFKRPTLPIRLSRHDTKAEVLRKLKAVDSRAEFGPGGNVQSVWLTDRNGISQPIILYFDESGRLLRQSNGPLFILRGGYWGMSTFPYSDVDIDR